MNDLAPSRLEDDLAALEDEAAALTKAVSELLRDVKKARTLAAKGLVRDLRRTVQALPDRADLIADQLRKFNQETDIDVTAMMADGSYAQEIIATARRAKVTIEEQDGRLLCYPSVVQLNPSDETVIIDKTRERRLRPSVLVELLKTRQDRPPTFRPEAFLESLERAYDLQIAREGRAAGSVVKLIDLHRVLTLLPTQRKDYPEADFARDLYLLDQSGTNTTKAGRRLDFQASAMTRGKALLQTVTKTGRHKIYAGVSFT